MIRYIFLLFFVVTSMFAQADWVKWDQKSVEYTKVLNKNIEYKPEHTSFFTFFTNTAKKVYKTVFSNLDGENCPFTPTCSNFYVESVEKGGIIKGTLMFFDRFTRDANLFKNFDQYKIVNDNKFYDPVNNYLLKPEIIELDIK
ncbi:MAG: membrane protein insertion efficiency factor YidD [bacterium]